MIEGSNYAIIQDNSNNITKKNESDDISASIGKVPGHVPVKVIETEQQLKLMQSEPPFSPQRKRLSEQLQVV
eukprot:CAMPEP_0178901116 /NCGR_PEP_ID=MMETSP0786-20121207/3837_1 /TAXON_ID=186022 /ORGANISM="Thalassionema frauenfeldii, Strain CCMP 1798" /LENGTH=71 /DNA_ID=CAMNT_0020572169 /DNA_START=630 /DNA_END=842 /DNA_ORIENTATION=-